MKRRNFIGVLTAGGSVLASGPVVAFTPPAEGQGQKKFRGAAEHAADVVVAGGGLGGVAAALSSLRNGLSVILTEETDWIGGQITQQGVPPDEHQWIETHGATKPYRDFRTGVRES